MPVTKQWPEMSVDEKLEALRQEVESQQRDRAFLAKALEDVRRRLDEIERCLEELPLS